MQIVDLGLKHPGAILLISCYDLGHQPFGVAVSMAHLERAGYSPVAMDTSVEAFDQIKVETAKLVAISVAMHTALRLAVDIARRVRLVNNDCALCFFGLYAVLNADYLRERFNAFCFGPHEEIKVVELAERLNAGIPCVLNGHQSDVPFLRELPSLVPSRSNLVGLGRYSKLDSGGCLSIAGYVEASRGCFHLCSHCPLPAVFHGKYGIVPEDIVLGDIEQQIASGAVHITFGDPDFLNGPTHSLRIVSKMHSRHPQVTFDCTAKIEHIVKHDRLIRELGHLGCVFVVSAVESLNDKVLSILKKNHTRQDVEEAHAILTTSGIAFRPTWIPFTPWGTLQDYRDMLRFVNSHGLIGNVDPVQYTLRLLVPPRSLLITDVHMQPYLRGLKREALTYVWQHPDHDMDDLCAKVTDLVKASSRSNMDCETTFVNIWSLVMGTSDEIRMRLARRGPRLTESWFC